MEKSISTILNYPPETLNPSQAIRDLTGWLRKQSEDTPEGELPEREDIAAVTHEVGQLWFELNNNKLAVKYFCKSLKLQIDLLGQDHPEVADLWSELGFAYGELRSADQAIMCHQKSLLIRLNHFGADHFSLAECYDGVALSLRVKRKVDEAIEYHRKAISIRNLSGNESHRDTILSYNGMGLCYRRKRQFKKAIGIFRRLTKIHTKLSGKEHISSLGIGITFHNLGLAYGNDGQYKKSIAWHKRAIQKFEKQLNPGNSIIDLNRRQIARGEECLRVQERTQLNIARLQENEALGLFYLNLNN
jgi:tetratricopeptide (TPR) repeat protein